MRLPGPAGRHLTYCTNVHPGESWPEVHRSLREYVVPVRERVAPGRPFGLGLRLSGRAARELAEPGGLEQLRALLRRHDLYVFTLNGFPHGTFHGQPVKEEVYLPDWLDPERVSYSNRLADLLAAVLPEELEGTISTVPGAFAPRVRGAADAARMASAIALHVAHLLRVRENTGRSIALALEPEPCCYLETVEETVDFFQRFVFADAGVAALAAAAGLGRAEAEAALRRHVGACLDTCHMAVEYEDPAAAVAALEGAGIRIAKVQVSAGLRAVLGADPAPALAALDAFADDVYLHQVVERRPDGRLVRHLDLPQALAAARGGGGAAGEWRVHFHVPLFRERLGPFQSTQAYVRDALALLGNGSRCQHFEVETYTWGVLPPEHRADDLAAAVAREVEWAAAALEPAG